MIQIVNSVNPMVEINSDFPRRMDAEHGNGKYSKRWSKCSKCENLSSCKCDEKDFDENGNCRFYKKRKTMDTRPFSELFNEFVRTL